MTLACSSMYLDEIMFRLLRVQMGKLKSLCESFFKLKDIKVRLFVEEEVMNCNCIVYDYCLVYLLKRSGAVPFMHKVVYVDYCIYWNRDALYHNFLRRTRPLSWSLELARARPLLWTKRVSQSSSEKSGNYMAQTTLQLLLVSEEREES